MVETSVFAEVIEEIDVNDLNQKIYADILEIFKQHQAVVPIKNLPAELRAVHDQRKEEVKRETEQKGKKKWLDAWLWAWRHPEERVEGYVSDGLRYATNSRELQALYAYAWSEGMVEDMIKISKKQGCDIECIERLVLRQYLDAHVPRSRLEVKRLASIIREYGHHGGRVVGLLFKHHIHRLSGQDANSLAEEFLKRRLTNDEVLRLEIYSLASYYLDYFDHHIEDTNGDCETKAMFLWQVFLRLRSELIGDHMCRTWLRLREVGPNTIVYLANREEIVPYLLGVSVEYEVWWAVGDLMEEYVGVGKSTRDEFISGLWQKCLNRSWSQPHYLEAYVKHFQRTPEEALPAFITLLESILSHHHLSDYELDQVRSLFFELDHYGCGDVVKKLNVDFSGVRSYGALG